jgi:GTP pyrophosphokinase
VSELAKLIGKVISPDERIQSALGLALYGHAGQTRRNGMPYIVHPLRVAGSLIDFGFDRVELVAAGLLHDVLEDTHLLPETIHEKCGSDVLGLVVAMTAAGCDTAFKVEKALKAGPSASILKIVDRIDNLRDTAELPPSPRNDAFRKRYVDETHKHFHRLTDYVSEPALTAALEDVLDRLTF